MEYMFWYAYAIKQNLCSWRLKNFPFAKSGNIFRGSGCQYKQNPVDSSSSFCQSQCPPALDSANEISIKSRASSMCDALDHMSVDVEVCNI